MSVLNRFGNSNTSGNNSHLTQAGKTGGLVAGTVVAMLAMSSVQAEGPTPGTSVDGGDIATSQFNLTPAELENINQTPFAGTGYGGFTISKVPVAPQTVSNQVTPTTDLSALAHPMATRMAQQIAQEQVRAYL